MTYLGQGVVLRIRGSSRNLVVQCNGLDFKSVTAAAQEALNFLEEAAQNADPTDILSPVQGLPLTCGTIPVMQTRLTVVYRIVGQLMIMVVSGPWANTMSLVSLASAIARVAVMEVRAPDMPVDRVEKKLPELYLAISGLLHQKLSANAAVDDARAIIAHAGDEKKASLPRKHVGDGVKAVPLVNYRGTKRTINQVIQQMAQVSFPTEGALYGIHPRPGFEPIGTMQPPTSAPAAAAADQFLTDMFGNKEAKAPAKVLGDPFADLEALLPVPTKAEEKDKDEVQAKDEWADFDSSVPAAPLLPAKPVLRLVESWRGEFKGGRLVRAGLVGNVGWESDASRTQVRTVQFMLQLPDSSSSSSESASGVGRAADVALQHALGAARRSPIATQQGAAQGVLVADAAAAGSTRGTGGTAPLLRYSLPAAASPQPLQVELGAHMRALPDGRLMVAVSLQYAISPRLQPSCTGMSIDWSLPPLLELPIRVEPAAKADSAKRTLSWQLPQQGWPVSQGSTGSVLALFMLSLDEGVVWSALRRMQAHVKMCGAAGRSLTGVSLAQGVVDIQETRECAAWSADVMATVDA